MLEPKRIHVTTAEIANGKFRDEKQCPIALALQHAYPNVNFVVHTQSILHLAGGNLIARYLLPHRITKWIDNYDHRLPAQPIDFTFPSFEE